VTFKVWGKDQAELFEKAVKELMAFTGFDRETVLHIVPDVDVRPLARQEDGTILVWEGTVEAKI
jgi:hypothetical protein